MPESLTLCKICIWWRGIVSHEGTRSQEVLPKWQCDIFVRDSRLWQRCC